VRFHDFETITRSVTTVEVVDSGMAVAEAALTLLAGIDTARGVRLLGVSVSNLLTDHGRQLRLDDPPEERWGSATEAIDEIRRRYGAASIGPARLLGPSGLHVARRG